MKLSGAYIHLLLLAQVSHTASYKALDDLTVEWVGVPGFMDGLYQTKFFSPLPQHVWASIPVGELSSTRNFLPDTHGLGCICD